MATAGDTKTAVLDVLDQFARAYEERDAEALLALCAPGDEVEVVGTGVDEIRLGADEVRLQYGRDFSEAQGISIEYRDRRVTAAGDVAWVLTTCSVEAVVAKQAVHLDLRLTGVLERRADGWRFRQLHVSVPMAGQDPGRSFPTA